MSLLTETNRDFFFCNEGSLFHNGMCQSQMDCGLCVWAGGETGRGGGWKGKDVWMATDRGRKRMVTAVGLLC